MIVPSLTAARIREGEVHWVAAAISVISACAAVLFITEPFLFTLGLFVSLVIAAFISLDFCAYASIFLLPWHPLVDLNLPIRDVSLVLHFVLFVGTLVRLRRRGRCIHDWLLGSKLKKGILFFAGISTASFLHSGLPGSLDSSRPLVLLISYIAVYFAIDGWLESKTE